MTANGDLAAKAVPPTTWPHACSCALLNASVGCVGRLACSAGVASGKLSVPSAGTWYVAVRYEAPYHFEAEFTVTVKQGLATRLTKLYGRRSSPKIWAFGWSARNHQTGFCGADQPVSKPRRNHTWTRGCSCDAGRTP